MSEIVVGTIINTYRITQELGRGLLGVTYLAEQTMYNPQTGRPIIKQFTLKTVNLDKAQQLHFDPQVITQEIQQLIDLSKAPKADRHIASYYEYFMIKINSQNILVLIMDYIEGQSLKQYMLENLNTKTDQWNDQNLLLLFMEEIASAVSFIHEHGIAHQDLKPSNIIFDSKNRVLKLTDFSLSCSVLLNAQCKGKSGDVYYMPPELIGLKVDPSHVEFAFRATHDVWSMGVIFFQLANLGRDYIHFTNYSPPALAQAILLKNVIPSDYHYAPINTIINSMLNKDYTQRPTSPKVVLMIKRARPTCKVNTETYNRQEAFALLYSLGINIGGHIDDYSLCRLLTEHLQACMIGNNKYDRKGLLDLAKALGLNINPNISSKQLCVMIGSTLEKQRQMYSTRVTEKIIHAVEYITVMTARKQTDILGALIRSYQAVYKEAKKLKLVNLELLEQKREELSLKVLFYYKNASKEYAKMLAQQVNMIIDIILDFTPNAEINGTPLAQYKFT